MTEHDDLQRRLRHLGTQPIDSARQSTDLTAMAGLAGPARRPGLLGSKLRLAGAFLAGLLIGSTGLAAADALPDSAQHVAHNVLAQVGVDVPDPERYHGAECGSEVRKNHGAYVRDDKALAQSDCGKPVGGVEGGDDADGDDADGEGKGNGTSGAKGPCQGKPPWAGNKSMTDAEVAAAKAERAALCGTEVDDDADELEDEAEQPDESDAEDPAARGSDVDEPTTTTAPTTTAPPTTEDVTTTTAAAPNTSTTP